MLRDEDKVILEVCQEEGVSSQTVAVIASRLKRTTHEVQHFELKLQILQAWKSFLKSVFTCFFLLLFVSFRLKLDVKNSLLYSFQLEIKLQHDTTILLWWCCYVYSQYFSRRFYSHQKLIGCKNST